MPLCAHKTRAWVIAGKSDDYNNRIAIITGFNIDKESKSEESVVVEESDENLSQTDLEYDADVETFSAESSREQKARLDAITPSDSRLGGVCGQGCRR